MKVELTSSDIRIMDEALTAWESACISHTFTSELIACVFAPKDEASRLRVEKERDLALKKADAETLTRKRTATLLRTRLYQAEAQLSEHELSEKEAM